MVLSHWLSPEVEILTCRPVSHSEQCLELLMVGKPLTHRICVDISLPSIFETVTDYSSVTRTLMFEPGEATVTVEVHITDDSVPEPAEQFTASLMSDAPNIIINVGEATITIRENDQGM